MARQAGRTAKREQEQEILVRNLQESGEWLGENALSHRQAARQRCQPIFLPRQEALASQDRRREAREEVAALTGAPLLSAGALGLDDEVCAASLPMQPERAEMKGREVFCDESIIVSPAMAKNHAIYPG